MQTKEVKHILGDGTEQIFTRLFADDKKVLTKNHQEFWNCIDVLPYEAGLWEEIDEPELPTETNENIEEI